MPEACVRIPCRQIKLQCFFRKISFQTMAEIIYPFDRTIPAEAPFVIAPDVVWLRMPLPYVLNHVNVWLLKDGDGWCAIDTGATCAAGIQVWENCLRTYRLVKQVVTHAHPDHAGMAGWLEKKTGASLWMTHGGYLSALARLNQWGNYSVGAMVRLFRMHGLDEKRLDMLASYEGVYRRDCPFLPVTFHGLRDGGNMVIGDDVCEVMTGYGHAVEHASLYCRKKKLLVAGDMLLPSIITNIPVAPANPEDDPLQDFLDSIRRYRSLPDDVLVLPAHGRPFKGIHARLDFLESYHRLRTEKVLSVCQKACTARDIVPVLFEKGMDEIHQCMFAMGESIAYLNHLEKQGKLARQEQEGMIRFVKV